MREWAEMISARKRSGKTVNEWCAEIGMSRPRYFYRLKQVRNYAVQELSAQMDGQTTLPKADVNAALAPPGFLKVSLEESPQPTSSSVEVGAGHLQMEVSGMRITADEGYPSDKLAALLQGLKESC